MYSNPSSPAHLEKSFIPASVVLPPSRNLHTARPGFSHADCLQVVQLLNGEGVDLLEVSGGNYEQPRLLGVTGRSEDAVDVPLTWHRRKFRIVDTAGMRRAGRVAGSGPVESVSVLLTRRAIESADVTVLMIDSAAGVTDQDAAIAGAADKAGSSIIIAANKWDLMKGRGPEFVKEFDEELRRQLKFLDYAPVLHISAATGERTPRLLETIDRVAESRSRRVPRTGCRPRIKRSAAPTATSRWERPTSGRGNGCARCWDAPISPRVRSLPPTPIARSIAESWPPSSRKSCVRNHGRPGSWRWSRPACPVDPS